MSNSQARITRQEYQKHAEDAALDMSNGQADILTTRLFFRLLRLGNRLSKDFESAIRQKSKLSFPGYQLLFSLKAVGDVGSIQLARIAGVSTASMTSLLHTLEGKGYVLRKEDPDDARKKIVSLTGAGQELVSALHRENMARELAWSKALTRDQAEQLNQLVSALLEHQPSPVGAELSFDEYWKHD